MAVTWLSESPSAQVRAFRAAWLLLALFAGLVQKPRVAMAWDILATLRGMRAVHALKAAPVVMGTTLILVRQVYADKGQQLSPRSRAVWYVPSEVGTRLPCGLCSLDSK